MNYVFNQFGSRLTLEIWDSQDFTSAYSMLEAFGIGDAVHRILSNCWVLPDDRDHLSQGKIFTAQACGFFISIALGLNELVLPMFGLVWILHAL